MPQRNVATNFTFEQQRLEINLLAQDFWTQKGTVDTAAGTYLLKDGSNSFTGATLAVPNAFTINSNSGNGTVTIAGNLQVDGTTTTLNSTTLEIADKNIVLAKGSANDAAADGAGITVDSATDKTFNFVDADGAFVSSIGLKAVGNITGAAISGTTGTFSGNVNTGPVLTITGGEGVSADFYLIADQGDDNGDGWRIKSNQDDNDFTLSNNESGSYVDKLTILKGGQVGIGVVPKTGEGTELAVKGTDGATNIALVPNADTESSQISFYNAAYNSTQGYIKYDNNDDSLQFRVNLQPRLHIKSDGRLGIGTVAPSRDMVHIHNPDANASNYIQFTNANTGGTGINDGTLIGISQNNSNTDGTGSGFTILNKENAEITLGTNGDERLRIDKEGRVSINTEATQGQLNILNSQDFSLSSVSNNTDNIWLVSDATSADDAYGASIGFSRIQYPDRRAAAIASVQTSADEDHVGLAFFTHDNADAAQNIVESLRIEHNGVVGVGVTNPAVAGNYHGMEIGGHDNSGLRLSTTAAGGWAFTDYEINGTQTYMVGVKGGTDSLSSASSWRICSGASFDANQLFVVNSNGSVLPGSDNTQDFGSSSFRWANVYTGDMHLNNMHSGGNEVDGTEGHWTMQEGSDDLFLINRNTGKKYKFNLTEV